MCLAKIEVTGSNTESTLVPGFAAERFQERSKAPKVEELMKQLKFEM